MPTEEQLSIMKEKIEAAEESIAYAEAEFTKAERVGIDVKDDRKHVRELAAKVKRFRTVYEI